MSTGFLLKKAVMSNVKNFAFQKIGEETFLNQMFHNSGVYKSVVYWAAIFMVKACAISVNGVIPKQFPLRRKVAALNGQVKDVSQQN